MRINKRMFLFPVFLLFILGLLIIGSTGDKKIISGQGWGLISIEIIIIILALLYWLFEQGQTSSREVAVIAVLGTIAAAGRVLFMFIPNIQPVTFIVIVSGYVFGIQAGFMVGSTAALVSNFFMGHGPWSPWQMFAWGLAGASAGVVKSVFTKVNSKGMTLFCFIWGYLFGWIMNLWSWMAFVQPLTWKTYIAYDVASFWFDTFHAVGNAVFYLLFGPGFIKILRRFHRRLEIIIVKENN